MHHFGYFCCKLVGPDAGCWISSPLFHYTNWISVGSLEGFSGIWNTLKVPGILLFVCRKRLYFPLIFQARPKTSVLGCFWDYYMVTNISDCRDSPSQVRYSIREILKTVVIFCSGRGEKGNRDKWRTCPKPKIKPWAITWKVWVFLLTTSELSEFRHINCWLLASDSLSLNRGTTVTFKASSVKNPGDFGKTIEWLSKDDRLVQKSC